MKKNLFFLCCFLLTFVTANSQNSNVNVSVNMTGHTESFNTVYISGGFNNWAQWDNPLNDDDMDGVWTGTVQMPSGEQEFKFQLDGWAAQEMFTDGDACTNTTFASPTNFVNRVINVNGETDLYYNYNVAQCAVTFCVDMSTYAGAIDNPTPYVSGTFNNWAQWDNALTDADGDGIWKTTIPLAEGIIDYKFQVNGWADQEDLVPIAAEACVATKFENTNRELNVTSNSETCYKWESCETVGGSSDVIFCVDMNSYTSNFSVVYLAGTFNGWSASGNPLTDVNGDGIWTTTLSLPPGEIEYKFQVDSWSDQENFAGGESCTKTTSGFTNRVLTVAGESKVCHGWNNCDPCKKDITFCVDMSDYSAPFTTVYVAGTFNGWSQWDNPLSDPDNDGIWTTTLPLDLGEIEYKFQLDGWAAQEALTPGSSCTKTTGVNTNRILEIIDAKTICTAWNGCDPIVKTQGPIPTCPNLVWADEFDDSSLDAATWEAQIGDGTGLGIPGWGNNELQYYRSENATVTDGKLTITAKEESFGGKNYTSARLRTKGKVDFAYGRMEASIKLPIGQGLWPAFWMLSTDEVYGGWPQSGEIDIMEYLGHEPEKAFGTIHYGDLFPNNKFTSGEYFLPDGTFNDDFHEFAIEWDENVIRWYIDDILYSTKTPTDIAPEFWPFNQNFHFLLNIAVGGNLPGSPNASTVFPQTMEVDYVRVYKGQFPYINGNQLVANKASGEVYTVGNAPSGSTYTWTVPAGATITSGDGTASITVDWGNTSGLQDITVAVAGPCTTENLSMMVKVDVERVEILECPLENFDTESLLTLTSVNNKGETGILEENASNPAPNNVNSSSLVGKYTRSTNQFDNFQYSTTAIVDAAKFASTSPDKKFFIDIYTTAAPGKVITLQLENTAKIGDFPAGRHSRFTATTTVQNAWQRLEFKFDARLDGNVLDTEVDNMVFLFDANTNNTDTYFFDNFDKFCTSSVGECASIEPCSSTGGACSITNLQASSCPNGTLGSELVTVRVADNPSCFQSIEVPVCSDGSMVDITFDYNEVSFAPTVSTTIFELLVDGQVVATGGTDIGNTKIQFAGIITPKSGAAGGVAATGSGGTPMVSVSDPCNCDDTGNILNANGTIRLFRDELTFTGVGAVVCTGNCGVFLDATGNPITNFGTSPSTVEFYRVPGNYSSSTFTIGGSVATLNGGTCTDSCREPIPTMSQWGLIIFGLLMLNLGLMLLSRKEFNNLV